MKLEIWHFIHWDYSRDRKLYLLGSEHKKTHYHHLYTTEFSCSHEDQGRGTPIGESGMRQWSSYHVWSW